MGLPLWPDCSYSTCKSMTVASKPQTYSQAQLFPVQLVTQAKPFLKWAGGKSRLLPILRQYLPKGGFRRYIEPFLGGGAFFFDTAPGVAILGDSNPELIKCYEAVRDIPGEVIRTLQGMRVSESDFYEIRSQKPVGLPTASRAARFIYLNKTCYNGLYRVNKTGEFNTCFGKYAGHTPRGTSAISEAGDS